MCTYEDTLAHYLLLFGFIHNLKTVCGYWKVWLVKILTFCRFLIQMPFKIWTILSYIVWILDILHQKSRLLFRFRPNSKSELMNTTIGNVLTIWIHHISSYHIPTVWVANTTLEKDDSNIPVALNHCFGYHECFPSMHLVLPEHSSSAPQKQSYSRLKVELFLKIREL